MEAWGGSAGQKMKSQGLLTLSPGGARGRRPETLAGRARRLASDALRALPCLSDVHLN